MSESHDDAQRLADLDLDPNEASGLLRVRDRALLEHFGWDRGFWAVLDEVDVAECVVLLGHASGAPPDGAWEVQRLHGERNAEGEDVRDAEAVAAWDGWVYVFGSHHGGKEGPIGREQQWIARFREADVVGDEKAGVPGVMMDVADTAYRLHRLVNDALAAGDVEVVPMADATRKDFIDATIDNLRDTPQQGLVRPDDWTINIEGADFTADGAMLLGLRFPISADGRPLVVQLTDWEGLFDQPMALPTVDAIWEVDAVGRNGSMAGVRDLCVRGDELHVVSGDLDSAGKGSVIREDYAGGTQTVATHFVGRLAGGRGGRVEARVVREFPDNPRIEGIAADEDGAFFYVSDEDEFISLRSTPLLTGGDG